MRRWGAIALLMSACDAGELPPLGEAIVFVDTDLPVPRVASRLRVDVHALSGEWLESREIARPDPRDWPVSFSVQAADDRSSREVVLRLRIDGGRSRDYRGAERWVRDGVDVTPTHEPEPALAVDRVVRLRLVPGVRRRVSVVARARCAGTSAVIAAPSWESCVETENAREPAPRIDTEAVTDAEVAPSLSGSAARAPCSNVPAGATCIEGGAFVLGSEPSVFAPDLAQSPQSVALVSSFAMDRHEVTVARYRRALAAGFVPPTPPAVGGDCSFSEAPADREDLALTCVPWATARAFCVFDSGDLPSEAEWEYAATSAGRMGKSEFSWGDELPDCERAVYGRLALAGSPGACAASARGPQPVVSGGHPVAPADLSASGIYGMGGGVAEWVRDVPAAYSSSCWTRTKVDPGCFEGGDGAHVVRGGAWASPPLVLRATSRIASAAANAFIGFRCVYAESAEAL